MRNFVEQGEPVKARVAVAEPARQIYQIFWFGLQADHDPGANVHLPRCAPKRLEAAAASKL